MSKKILHIGSCDKFIPPYIDFIRNNFDCNEHKFLLRDGMASKEIKNNENIYLSNKTKLDEIKYLIHVVVNMHISNKIILHSLFDRKIVGILYFMPWLLNKCYWVLWGADYLYEKKSKNSIKNLLNKFPYKFVIKNVYGLITYIPESIDIVRNKYGAKGRYYECLAYTSNVVTNEISEIKKSDMRIRVLIGNSATKSNNHFDIFKKIHPFMNSDVILYAPLSYGDNNYAEEVMKEGKRLFGEQFLGLNNFQSISDYKDFLRTIDIVIFNHDRHQGMGNLITMLGMGKKVFMRKDIPSWSFFVGKEIEIDDYEKFNGFSNFDINFNNKVKIKKYFSEVNLAEQWGRIFDI